MELRGCEVTVLANLSGTLLAHLSSVEMLLLNLTEVHIAVNLDL